MTMKLISLHDQRRYIFRLFIMLWILFFFFEWLEHHSKIYLNRFTKLNDKIFFFFVLGEGGSLPWQIAGKSNRHSIEYSFAVWTSLVLSRWRCLGTNEFESKRFLSTFHQQRENTAHYINKFTPLSINFLFLPSMNRILIFPFSFLVSGKFQIENDRRMKKING